jgi:hypothetical protein
VAVPGNSGGEHDRYVRPAAADPVASLAAEASAHDYSRSSEAISSGGLPGVEAASGPPRGGTSREQRLGHEQGPHVGPLLMALWGCAASCPLPRGFLRG